MHVLLTETERQVMWLVMSNTLPYYICMHALRIRQEHEHALGRSQRTLCTVGQSEGPLVLLSQSPLDTQRHLFLRWPHRWLCYQSRMGKLLWLKIVMHLPQSP